MLELTHIESSNHLKEVSKKNEEIKTLKEKVKEIETQLNNQMCVHQSTQPKNKLLRSEASTLKQKCKVKKNKH